MEGNNAVFMVRWASTKRGLEAPLIIWHRPTWNRPGICTWKRHLWENRLNPLPMKTAYVLLNKSSPEINGWFYPWEVLRNGPGLDTLGKGGESRGVGSGGRSQCSGPLHLVVAGHLMIFFGTRSSDFKIFHVGVAQSVAFVLREAGKYHNPGIYSWDTCFLKMPSPNTSACPWETSFHRKCFTFSRRFLLETIPFKSLIKMRLSSQ